MWTKFMVSFCGITQKGSSASSTNGGRFMFLWGYYGNFHFFKFGNRTSPVFWINTLFTLLPHMIYKVSFMKWFLFRKSACQRFVFIFVFNNSKGDNCLNYGWTILVNLKSCGTFYIMLFCPLTQIHIEISEFAIIELIINNIYSFEII